MNTDPESFESFTTFYQVDGNGKVHIQNANLIPSEWSWICYLEGEYFHSMQTRFAIEYHYQTVRAKLKDQGIDVDEYSPILRGTVLSLAIRNGIYLEDLGSIVNTYYDGIEEEAWLREIYAGETRRHPDQEERWRVDQKEAALEALAAYHENPFDGNIGVEWVQLLE